MKNYLIGVEIPENDKYLVVEVKNAENAKHARLVAYYHIYGKLPISLWKRVKELTKVEQCGGVCDASLYEELNYNA